LWIKYYNYKRPHQGIGGLCSADRFFEIQHALKQTLEKGVEENALELALRGKPRDPFYMVGRMGDQSVVIRAEKGKVRMLVDDTETAREKELVYDARKDIDHEDSQESSQKIVRSATENHRRAVGMDRAADNVPDVPGDGHQFQSSQPMAEPGHGGDAGGAEPEKAQRAGCIASGSSRAKKNERIMQAVAGIEELKSRFNIPYARILKEVGGPHYPSFMRWKRRIAAGKPPIKSPGPKKIAPLDPESQTEALPGRQECLQKLFCRESNLLHQKEKERRF
jgi:hypothetical protein